MEALENRVVRAADRPLRVLVDARKLADGGIGRYTATLLVALSHEPAVQCSVITLPGTALPPEARVAQNIEIATRSYSVAEYFGLARALPWREFDLFHEPHYTLPFFVPVPRVVTIHDLIHITHPTSWGKRAAMWCMVQSAIRRATCVLTVSEATRRDIARHFGERFAERIKVVSNFLVDRDSRPTRERQGGYLLAVCSTDKPHKGLADLLQAFVAAPLPWRLLVVGQGVGAQQSKLPGVEFRGVVSDQQLKELYRDAAYVVVPSLTEGFSLPVLEAHACGVPVIARPVPAILEQRVESDIFAANFSVAALVAALGAAADRGGLPVVAERETQRFTAENCVPSLLEAYRGAVGAT